MPISVRGIGLVTRALRGCAMQSVRTLSTGKWRLVKHRSTWFRPKPSGRPLLGFAPQALLLPWKSGWQKIHVACCSKATCHQKNTKLSNSIWRKTCRWLPKSQIHVFISNQAFQRMECGPTADHWDLPKQWNRWWSLPLLPCLTLGPSADIGVLPSSPEWISSSVDLLPRPDHITPSMYSHHHFLLLQNSLDSEVRNFVPVLSADQVHFQWQLQPLFPSFPRPILSFPCHLTLSRGSSPVFTQVAAEVDFSPRSCFQVHNSFCQVPNALCTLNKRYWCLHHVMYVHLPSFKPVCHPTYILRPQMVGFMFNRKSGAWKRCSKCCFKKLMVREVI